MGKVSVWFTGPRNSVLHLNPVKIVNRDLHAYFASRCSLLSPHCARLRVDRSAPPAMLDPHFAQVRA